MAVGAACLPAQHQGCITVIDERGTPVAGAVISRLAADGELQQLGTTDATGRCAVAARDVGEAYWQVHVVADGLCGVTARCYGFAFGTLDETPLVLGRGHVLHGRVRDQTGKPVVNARLCATDLRQSPWSGWTARVQARSDEHGIFALRGVPPQCLRLSVDADGYRSVGLAPVQLGTPLEVTLEPAAHLAGTVLDASGRPVAADLEVYYEGQDQAQTARSDADGRFDVTWRHAAFCRVVARQGEPMVAFAQSDVVQAPTAKMQLRLRTLDQLPLLRVRATGDDGAALTGFRAVALWNFDDKVPEQYLWQQLAMVGQASHGELAWLPKPPAEATHGVLFVHAPGRAPAAVPVDWSPGDDGSTEVRVATVPGQRVTGTVRDTAGAPVKARVWVQRVQKTDWQMPTTAPLHAAWSNADGTFVLDGLAPGPTDVFAARNFVPERKPKRVVVPATGDAQTIELELPEHVAVAGRAEGARAGWQLAFVPPWSMPGNAMGSMELPIQAQVAFAADGSFALTGVQPGLQTPTLLIPRAVQRGGWVRIPLSATRIGDHGEPDLQLVVIAPTRLHGRIVRRGAEPPFERLLVQQRLEPFPKALQGNDVTEFRAWTVTAPVGGDGAYELVVGPGKHLLRVIDTMTGIVLATTETPLAADKERIEAPDLVLDIAEVRLELAPTAADERGPALHLIHSRAGTEPNRFGFSIDDFLLHGIDLRDRLTTEVLYVPAGEGEFFVTRQTLPEAVEPFSPEIAQVFAQPQPEGDPIPFDAKAGQPITVRIEVPRRNL